MRLELDRLAASVGDQDPRTDPRRSGNPMVKEPR
jgi:hypothetical protein